MLSLSTAEHWLLIWLSLAGIVYMAIRLRRIGDLERRLNASPSDIMTLIFGLSTSLLYHRYCQAEHWSSGGIFGGRYLVEQCTYYVPFAWQIGVVFTLLGFFLRNQRAAYAVLIRAIGICPPAWVFILIIFRSFR